VSDDLCETEVFTDNEDNDDHDVIAPDSSVSEKRPEDVDFVSEPLASTYESTRLQNPEHLHLYGDYIYLHIDLRHSTMLDLSFRISREK
jgi:hypothetical protein